MKDPEFQEAYHQAKVEISAVDAVMRGIEEARVRRGSTKSDLAKLAGLPDTSVRRLLSQPNSNPGLATAAALAYPLGLEIALVSKRRPKKFQPNQSFGELHGGYLAILRGEALRYSRPISRTFL